MKVLVNGALGRMGQEVVKKIQSEAGFELAAVVDIHNGVAGGLNVDTDVLHAIKTTKPDVVVDFTKPDVVMDTLRKILPTGVACVVGTTGFSNENLEEVDKLANANKTAVLIAPNFALGAVVMIKLACEAAKYFPNVEIIEKHHDKKLDAPSGTAILTAQKIAEVRKKMHQGHPDEKETMAGCRGADFEGMKIHSLRLPGYVASQEVVFGGQGETLRIATEPINRECYMPGVILACQKIKNYQGLVYGLEKIL
ncbi:MAG: 4-hydroxy-tetrahydrodipicolinate reductase [Phascolarctobacterium sp.]|nr:4-hydroxy-tetrahydrodipicolinate reductase [Candidatus Phascolarctobacterium caballi]